MTRPMEILEFTASDGTALSIRRDQIIAVQEGVPGSGQTSIFDTKGYELEVTDAYVVVMALWQGESPAPTPEQFDKARNVLDRIAAVRAAEVAFVNEPTEENLQKLTKARDLAGIRPPAGSRLGTSAVPTDEYWAAKREGPGPSDEKTTPVDNPPYRQYQGRAINEESLRKHAKLHGATYLGEITGDKAQAVFRKMAERPVWISLNLKSGGILCVDYTAIAAMSSIPRTGKARIAWVDPDGLSNECIVLHTLEEINAIYEKAKAEQDKPGDVEGTGNIFAPKPGWLEDSIRDAKRYEAAQEWAMNPTEENLRKVYEFMPGETPKPEPLISPEMKAICVVQEQVEGLGVRLGVIAQQIGEIHTGGPEALANVVSKDTNERYQSIERAVHEIAQKVNAIRETQEQGAVEPDPQLANLEQLMGTLIRDFGLYHESNQSDFVHVRERLAGIDERTILTFNKFAGVFQELDGLKAKLQRMARAADRIDTIYENWPDRFAALEAKLQPSPQHSPFFTEEQLKNVVASERAAIWTFVDRFPLKERTKIREFLHSRDQAQQENGTNG